MVTTENYIRDILAAVKDPEIPVISIEDLGILREVNISNNNVQVVITPTYTGCPAMLEIETEIRKALKQAKIDNFEIKSILSPAWSTDFMTEEGKKKLKEYGIAPPKPGDKNINCPICGSSKTVMISQFGSTACKSLYKCNDCLEPFDYFKCH